MRRTLCCLVLASVVHLAAAADETASLPRADQSAPARPNIIVIISDDAGYADFSMHGSEQFRTPRIDSIAANGVRFTNGYVTASVCSPSRAGLLTGRYQQRYGHEFNIPPAFSDANGLPTDEQTLADLLRPGGYHTIGLGKWHLGYAGHFHPLSRGFDEFYGFLQGSRSYRPIKGTRLNRLLRDREPVAEDFTYMTDELARQAASYIAAGKDRPFFMYLAFNAVHTPMHAKDEDIAVFETITPKRRRTLAAMTKALDEAVGVVLDALTEHGLRDDTIVFFINDNGGATTNASSNRPLRGHKGQMFEGGIRVPLLVQWPAKLPRGRIFDEPVISLDIAPTALAAAGVTEEPAKPLDGVNLLPHIIASEAVGDQDEARALDRALFWREGDRWAIRRGPWKLLHQGGAIMLFNLAEDPSEQHDVFPAEQERVQGLRAAFDQWNAQLAEPRWRSRRTPAAKDPPKRRKDGPKKGEGPGEPGGEGR